MYILPDTSSGTAARKERTYPRCDQAVAKWGEHLKKKNYSETLIQAFLQHDKIVDIMEATGLSRSTIVRYRDSPDFQKALSDRRTVYVETAVTKMQAFMCEGVETLQNIIRDKNTSAQVKVNAIQILFAQCKSWTETVDVLKRLEALENCED